MKLLVLGGTVFLSRAVVEAALARGHDVVALNRGSSGTVPDGARHVVADRDGDFPAELADEGFDAVVDVSRTPSHVRKAVAALPDAYWVFVSTINVYSDEVTPGGRPGTLPLREPEYDDVGSMSPESYGAMKVACEELVALGTTSRSIVRPGLIVGPGDPTGRFTYWPARMARMLDGGGADVLAPGSPTDLVQIIDVRDLATWIVTMAEERTEGVFDGIAPALEIGELLAAVAAGCGVEPRWTWGSRADLEAHEVGPWSGKRSLPLWLPRPEYDGMITHDAGPSLDAGLVPRPVEETARDTLEWLRATPDAVVTGLTADEEADVLAGMRSAHPVQG